MMTPEGDGIDDRQYCHEPLQRSSNIRVVSLLPAAGREDDIHCELHEDNLEVVAWHPLHQSYEALSWCLGHENATKPIYVHVAVSIRIMTVTDTLFQILHALRYSDRPRALWIDCICMNRGDLLEFHQQLPKMSEIYRHAQNVCIWLGAEDETSRIAFDFVRRLSRLFAFDDICSNPSVAESWAALLELMKRPWFSRRWIIQEIALAKSATLHCGAACVSWDDFSDAVSLFLQELDKNQRLSEALKFKNGFPPQSLDQVPGVALLLQSRDLLRPNSFGGHARQRSLESLVSSLSMFESSEPRDTIYALLAMARDVQAPATYDLGGLSSYQQELLKRVVSHLSRPSAAKIEVDYRTPVVDVYQKFMLVCIRNADPTRALDILCRPFARHHQRKHDYVYDPATLNSMSEIEKDAHVALPSWLPSVDESPFRIASDQKASNGSHHLMNHFRGQEIPRDTFAGSPEQKVYNAAGTRRYNDTRLVFKKRSSHYSMFVEGFVLDYINEKGSDAQGGAVIPSDWIDLSGWSGLRETSSVPSRWDAFWRTLVANRDAESQLPPAWYERACKEVLVHRVSHLAINIDELIMRSSSPIAGFLRRLKRTICDRCMIVTKDARLGLANRNVKAGDLICILYGCSVPVVLRQYEMNGKCQAREDVEDAIESQKRQEKAARLVKLAFDKIKARRKARKRKRLRQSWVSICRGCSLAILVVWFTSRNQGLAAAVIVMATSMDEVSRILIKRNQDSVICSRVAPVLVLLPLSLAKSKEISSFIWATIELCLMFVLSLLCLLPLSTWQTVYTCRERLQSIVKRNAFRLVIRSMWDNFTVSKPAIKPNRSGTKQYYILLGECYIHGMMEGEAIQWQNERNAKKTVFEIR